MRIADIPQWQRPRERVIDSGIGVASDLELVAMIIRQGSRQASAVELAATLLSSFGSVAELARASVGELARVDGIGPAKSTAVAAAFELARRVRFDGDKKQIVGASDVHEIVGSKLRHLRRERVLLLLCDARDQVFATTAVAEGSMDGATVPVREILNAALRADARSFALAHNHPSGDPTPSNADIRATAQLRSASAVVGLRMLDHVIVAGKDWASIG